MRLQPSKPMRRANGDGGRVIVWADDQTQSFGAISARGGSQGGDGGFVEVSGKHRLQFASTVDTRAPMGKTGILLLDPDHIQVVTSGSLGLPSGGVVAFGDAPAFLALDVATINSALSNVVLQANNQIDIDVPINIANADDRLHRTGGRLPQRQREHHHQRRCGQSRRRQQRLHLGFAT